VAIYPLPAWAWSDALLVEVARAARALHDATVTLELPAGGWRRAAIEPVEVICHGDLAPYNTVCRDSRFHAFIDWDYAVPGPRLWDLGYLAYRWVALTDPSNPDGNALPIAEQRRRLALLADAYGDVTGDELAASAARRLEDLIGYTHEQSAAGNAELARTIELGHVELYRRDLAWIRTRLLA
jgi:aminoglycoside phosphotransferase (APT) family kinase protein